LGGGNPSTNNLIFKRSGVKEEEKALVYPIVAHCWKCKKQYSKEYFCLESYCPPCFEKFLNYEPAYTRHKKKEAK